MRTKCPLPKPGMQSIFRFWDWRQNRPNDEKPGPKRRALLTRVNARMVTHALNTTQCESSRDLNRPVTQSWLGACHGQHHIQFRLSIQSGATNARPKLVAIHGARRSRHYLRMHRIDLSRTNDAVAGDRVLRLYASRWSRWNHLGCAGDPPQGGPLGIADI